MRHVALRLLIAGVVAIGTVACATFDRPRSIEAGFWIEHLTYDLVGWGGPMRVGELALVESAALDEIRRAFAGVAVRFSLAAMRVTPLPSSSTCMTCARAD